MSKGRLLNPVFFGVLLAMILVGCANPQPAMPTNLTVSGSNNTITITTMTSTMGSLALPTGLPGIP